MKDLIVLDNAISKELQDFIEDNLTKSYFGFPWLFVDNITSPTIPDKLKHIGSIGFAHPMMQDDRVISNKLEIVYPIVEEITNHLQIEFKTLSNARAFMHVPHQPKNREYDFVHIDMIHPHTVILYYVNRKYKENDDFDEINLIKLPVRKKVTPKKGRAVIFDGMMYHASSPPSDKIRCIVNFGLI
jgi:hypothetical protein